MARQNRSAVPTSSPPIRSLRTRPARWRGRAAQWIGAPLLAALWAFPAAAALPADDLLDELLLRYVRDGFVDYDGIRADGRLGDYLSSLSDTGPEVLDEPAARMAFYINAYNALAIHGILSGYSTDGAWARKRFFKGLKQPIAGQPMSLDMIEHQVLRPMGDARIHFAIVCASLSCPRLSPRAFRAESLDSDLEAAARRFINDPTRNRYDPERRRAFLSALFDWFGEDFEGSAGSIQRFLAPYATDASIAALLREDGFDIRFQPYDWGLNGRHQPGR
jgi:hypothetical protein